jgi:hypothetical protein
VIKLFRPVIIRGRHNAAILRLAVLVCLWSCLQTHLAFACRYNVREAGFVDLQIEPYHLFGYVNDKTDTNFASKFKQIADIGLENSNIRFEIINTDQQKDHPAMKLLDLQQVKSLPAAVLVSPDGQSYPVSITEHNRSFEETLRSVVEEILSSPKREEILRKTIENYAVILLIEGTNAQENQRAKEAAFKVIELISSQMDMLPKSIARPPAFVAMDSKSCKSEKILLWSLALDGEEVNEPQAAVIYGRGRWIGPMFRGKEITEDNLANVLFVIGQDCECGLDHRWLQGTMLPAKWDEKMNALVVENLGFDPENPMIKMEMSMIVRRGSYSYPGVPPKGVPFGTLGYQEIAIEPNSAMEERKNLTNDVEYTTMTDSSSDNLISELNPSVEHNSLFRNTIFLLVGLCFLVLTSGIVILVRTKNR